jgi:oligopeptide/dipeptide ABC transporter ATP-binding protein
MNPGAKTFDYAAAAKLVEARGLCTWFPLKHGITDFITGKPKRFLKAVNDVSLDIYKGENLGLVGESGCGKSTLAKTIIRLYEPTKGQLFLRGKDIAHARGEALRRERPEMQMIFQDPYSSLNPRMSVREILEEMLSVHRMVGRDRLKERVGELLEMSGLSMDIADRFPGEFSGGQRQRIGIARALSLQPELIIADEPVSALDVSIQAQIINLLSSLQKTLHLTLLFISHDLRVVRHITHRVAVMYLGSIVESGPTEAVFREALHPYTSVLINAAPVLDPTSRVRDYEIVGEPPSPIDTPPGCKFHPRCVRCGDGCRTREPALRELLPGRFVACHFPLVQG